MKSGNNFAQIWLMLKAGSSSFVLLCGHGAVFILSLLISIALGFLAYFSYEIPVYELEIDAEELVTNNDLQFNTYVTFNWDYGWGNLPKQNTEEPNNYILWVNFSENEDTLKNSKISGYNYYHHDRTTDSILNILNEAYFKEKKKNLDSVAILLEIKTKECAPPHTFIRHLLPSEAFYNEVHLIAPDGDSLSLSKIVRHWASEKKSVFLKNDTLFTTNYVCVLKSSPQNPIDLRGLTSWRDPSFFSMYDISQAYFSIKCKTPHISFFNMKFSGATDFYNMLPEPDKKTFDAITFSDSLKISTIKTKGLMFFARFAQLENIQLLRMFIITTLLGFFAGLSIKSLGKFLRIRSRKFKLKHHNELINKS